MNTFEFIKGVSRIKRSLCPKCNSDAPKIDTCEFCKGSRDYPLTDEMQQDYRRRWRLERLIENTPTDRMRKMLKDIMEIDDGRT